VLRRYRTYDQVRSTLRLDGLIVTGAPVDRLPFAQVRYWPELRRLLDDARQSAAFVLGLCWGALAVGFYLGIAPRVYDQKLFGVFTARSTQLHALTEALGGEFSCPHSRNAGFDLEALGRLESSGAVRTLVDSDEVGPVLVASSDDRFIMHLGHPEYPTERLVEEFERDRRQGQAKVPLGYDLLQPRNVWQASSTQFFKAWVDMLQLANATSPPRD
jgi:homoserine O-succinyltransferase